MHARKDDKNDPRAAILNKRRLGAKTNLGDRPGKTGPRVVNNRQSRQAAFEILCELLNVATRPGLANLVAI